MAEQNLDGKETRRVEEWTHPSNRVTAEVPCPSTSPPTAQQPPCIPYIYLFIYIFLCVGVFAPAPHLPSRLNPSSKVFFTRMWVVEALG